MKWERKFVKFPHKTINGKWFCWKYVWIRLQNEIGTQVEYDINPDGLEAKYLLSQIKQTKWTEILGIPESEKPKKKKENPRYHNFNDVLKKIKDDREQSNSPLTEGLWKTQTKKITRTSKPRKPPPPANPNISPDDKQLRFAKDGTKLLVGNQIYNLSTPWDITSATIPADDVPPEPTIGQIGYDETTGTFVQWTGKHYVVVDNFGSDTPVGTIIPPEPPAPPSKRYINEDFVKPHKKHKPPKGRIQK